MIKHALAAILLLSVISATSASARQDESAPDPTPVTAEERAAVIDRIGEMLERRYVFVDVGASCGAHLRAELAAGAFDDATGPATFARLLTEALQSVSRDRHMRVRVQPPVPPGLAEEHPARARARREQRQRRENYGFERVEHLEGNVGYLDLRHFAGTPKARPTATAAMRFLANADAIIFDMRKNGGGSPEMVRFICSYLFPEPTHLNTLAWREGDRTEEFWTLREVPGPHLGDVPVFVLTSSSTFSGAEEFSYNLKTRKRATLVGETTGGGANPGGTFPINERFGMFIPTGRAINPVTGTNWEGAGVEPDVAVPADEALDRALVLAREAAEAHRRQQDAALDALWSAFGERQVDARRLARAGRDERAAEVMTAALRAAHDAGLVEEMDLNALGYELLGRDRVALAIAVFRFNVEAYPASGNVYDSLAEAYMQADRNDLALEYYRRSLEVDPSNENAREMIEHLEDGG